MEWWRWKRPKRSKGEERGVWRRKPEAMARKPEAKVMRRPESMRRCRKLTSRSVKWNLCVCLSIRPSIRPPVTSIPPPPTPNVLHQSPHSKFQLESRKKDHRSNQETQSALQCNANDDVTRQPFVVQTYRFISESGQVAMLNDSSIWFIYFLSLSSIFIV